MNLIKKKNEQKKLRGKAAQIANRNANRRAAARPHRLIDKRNPFRPFKHMNLDEISNEIDDFTSNAGWTAYRETPDYTNILDRNMVKMFSILKSGIPSSLVKTFFSDYDDSDSVYITSFFDEFKKRPDVQARIENMKELIRRRKAIPLPLAKRREPGIQPKSLKMVDIMRRNRNESPTQRPMPMFGLDEILSQCEREYRRAPWMFPFLTNEIIRGFALKDADPQYTIPEEIKDGWYRVNMAWYRMVCNGKRSFTPGQVAYVTTNNDLIVETEDMYNASKTDWINEFTPITSIGFEVAKRMIMDNDILKSAYDAKTLDAYAEIIITSFGFIETNYSIARKISYVLVFLSSLIDGSQVYHDRIRNHEYTGEELIYLDRYTLLPEIFKDPTTDKTEIENEIKRKRRLIENKYYKLIKLNDPTMRKSMRPGRVQAPPIRSTFSSEDRKVPTPTALPNRTVVNIHREMQESRELAPGLFQKLKDRITQMSPIHCNKCDTEVLSPPYITPRGHQRLNFCSKSCFDRYKI